MREDTPSRTAAWVAAARGLGRHLPPELLLADDPYGTAFVTSPVLGRFIKRLDASPPKHLARVPGLGTWVLYMQVRTRLLDDAVRAFARAGGRQLVLLGAGYDCRALRMPELGDATVFEVDHPATQGHKRRVLDRLGVDSPSRYVVWDFEARPMAELPDALAASGHDRRAPSLTIWEGVTMYLTEPAIDASVAAIHAYSGDGSQLALTYFDRSRIERPSIGTRVIKALVAGVGEPYRWGWRPAELPAWMAARGFALEHDHSLADAAAALLPPDIARLVDDPHRRVAITAREAVAVAARA